MRRKRDDTGALRSRPMSIKSDKARAYERYALPQIPANCRVQLTGPVRVTLRIFYASERPDLDESVVLDVLQSRYAKVKRHGAKVRELVHAGVYVNDRQVREKHVYHGIDRTNPRTEVIVEPLAAQQCALGFGALQEVEHEPATTRGKDDPLRPDTRPRTA
ncbi:Holliday junction resolvase RusA-like endonuclease [Paraburkholderia sp. HC6.4b]|uniref:RusA family crossover junction endodeoxyribonuclease n=1 Tax=unclassified Paraburkholderia TaxID=2615204 RepID=UPI0018540BD2|nr:MULTISPECIES: RusA family crossover junction endodeoxyribonuclease [unclassified Paraburkholderia]MBB5408578.1 Holliday junction resolvase RusA-like endonuclease [Paraburkholderia sp. HC6.4b]MBB5450410.1 Holliday junction resolvase RusA-like endonuclease [Paraburkholderia sp. Kb1A]